MLTRMSLTLVRLVDVTNPGPILPQAAVSQKLAAVTKAAVIDPINQAMQEHPIIEGWVQQAENELIARSDEYSRTLGVKAVGLARLRKASVIDVNDVRQAASDMGVDPNVWSAWLLALASLFGGAAIATYVSLALAPAPPEHVSYWYSGVVVLALATVTLLILSRPRKRG